MILLSRVFFGVILFNILSANITIHAASLSSDESVYVFKDKVFPVTQNSKKVYDYASGDLTATILST
jgi:hypothetical protein